MEKQFEYWKEELKTSQLSQAEDNELIQSAYLNDLKQKAFRFKKQTIEKRRLLFSSEHF